MAQSLKDVALLLTVLCAVVIGCQAQCNATTCGGQRSPPDETPSDEEGYTVESTDQPPHCCILRSPDNSSIQCTLGEPSDTHNCTLLSSDQSEQSVSDKSDDAHQCIHITTHDCGHDSDHQCDLRTTHDCEHHSDHQCDLRDTHDCEHHSDHQCDLRDTHDCEHHSDHQCDLRDTHDCEHHSDHQCDLRDTHDCEHHSDHQCDLRATHDCEHHSDNQCDLRDTHVCEYGAGHKWVLISSHRCEHGAVHQCDHSTVHDSGQGSHTVIVPVCSLTHSHPPSNCETSPQISKESSCASPSETNRCIKVHTTLSPNICVIVHVCSSHPHHKCEEYTENVSGCGGDSQPMNALDFSQTPESLTSEAQETSKSEELSQSDKTASRKVCTRDNCTEKVQLYPGFTDTGTKDNAASLECSMYLNDYAFYDEVDPKILAYPGGGGKKKPQSKACNTCKRNVQTDLSVPVISSESSADDNEGFHISDDIIWRLMIEELIFAILEAQGNVPIVEDENVIKKKDEVDRAMGKFVRGSIVETDNIPDKKEEMRKTIESISRESLEKALKESNKSEMEDEILPVLIHILLDCLWHSFDFSSEVDAETDLPGSAVPSEISVDDSERFDISDGELWRVLIEELISVLLEAPANVPIVEDENVIKKKDEVDQAMGKLVRGSIVETDNIQEKQRETRKTIESIARESLERALMESDKSEMVDEIFPVLIRILLECLWHSFEIFTEGELETDTLTEGIEENEGEVTQVMWQVIDESLEKALQENTSFETSNRPVRDSYPFIREESSQTGQLTEALSENKTRSCGKREAQNQEQAAAGDSENLRGCGTKKMAEGEMNACGTAAVDQCEDIKEKEEFAEELQKEIVDRSLDAVSEQDDSTSQEKPKNASCGCRERQKA